MVREIWYVFQAVPIGDLTMEEVSHEEISRQTNTPKRFELFVGGDVSHNPFREEKISERNIPRTAEYPRVMESFECL